MNRAQGITDWCNHVIYLILVEERNILSNIPTKLEGSTRTNARERHS